MDENNVADATTPDSDDKGAVSNDLTVDQMAAEITKLKNINSDVIQSRDKAKARLRDFDTAADELANKELLEKEEFKTLYDELNSKHTSLLNTIKSKDIDNALKISLKEAGVTSVSTALKLMDKSNIELNDDGEVIGMSAVVDSLKEDHAILFQEAKKSPDPVVPTEDGAGDGTLDLTKLDMKNPDDRKKYKAHIDIHGSA